jgi:hypothetical protein
VGKLDDMQSMMKSASRNARYSAPYNGRNNEDNDTDMEKEMDGEDKAQRMRKKPPKGEEDREARLRTNEKGGRAE